MKIIGVVGPTASGKTALALRLARALDGELVGVDASQIYRGMSIGTGKATPDELGDVVHHLIDIVEPDHRFDAAQYVDYADAAIQAVIRRGHQPILVGGTGLYLRTLIWGICEAPPIGDAVRDSLRQRINDGKLGALHQQLRIVDPQAAGRIHPNDAQRIERALGVYLSTGRPLTDWQTEHGFAMPRYQHILVGLDWPRATLEARIHRRIDSMLTAGWMDEVRTLLEAGYHDGLPSMKALGYAVLAEVIQGRLSLDEGRDRIFRSTRKYAKRQMTWFKSMPSIRWFSGEVDVAAVIDYVCAAQAKEDA
ncbi:MAG: tRNA (adenosine(37)-N6)-dimethylallyltransferase MiaA [Myxococcota bacterium]|nr:tRNA (adenosine(37)-N6)-dimethylallyltransferase MiaA [Myxococcota bacterium]